ncbi:sphingosine kinase related protein [Leptospira ryugenii]|uniref:Sphingosine kinase related protein n=1 Tax=Leptospira ryugenii TaxID=1917863 RepID=A0A2P2E4U5_9LEPT|nr:diacylglycerol kinase family protein [Leptospira ryugenii]GBF51893.1 sphingosine kinase related protein [Leptospira ryugenii]
MAIKIILNPVSGGGASKKVWKQIQKTLSQSGHRFEFAETTETISAKELASEALKNGFDWIIGIGGDGTLSNIINGFFENGKAINAKAVFSPIPAGRGNDFVKTIQVPRNPKKAIEKVLNGIERSIDLIEVNYTLQNGEGKSTYLCLNLLDFGMGGEVVYKVNRSRLGRWLGGKIVFLLYTLICLFTYKNKKITLNLDNKKKIEERCRLIVLANGQYAGGGMWFAPKASLDDGQIDFLAITDIGIPESLLKFSKIYKGQLTQEDKVISDTIRYLEASSEEDVYIDVDGENMGKLPASFSIKEKCIKIKC